MWGIYLKKKKKNSNVGGKWERVDCEIRYVVVLYILKLIDKVYVGIPIYNLCFF
jgi:hypothetical protein